MKRQDAVQRKMRQRPSPEQSRAPSPPRKRYQHTRSKSAVEIVQQRSFQRIFQYFILLAIGLFTLFILHEARPHEHSEATKRLHIDVRLPQWELSEVLNSVKLSKREQEGWREELAGNPIEMRVWPGWKNVETIFAFGDSHTATAFDPAGFQPSPENPLGNPLYPETANLGPNYLVYLTKTFNKSFIRTYNLAVPKSYLLPKEYDDLVPTLPKIIDDHWLPRYAPLKDRDPIARPGAWAANTTLFLFYAGLDDAVTTFYNEATHELPRNEDHAQARIESYMASLERIYNAGGRNFLVIGIPALEECPKIRTADIPRSVSRFGAEEVDMNARIAFGVQMFAHRHLDATVWVFNTLKMSTRTRTTPFSGFPELTGVTRVEGYCYPYAEKDDWPIGEHGEVWVLDDLCRDPLNAFYWRDQTHMTGPWHRLLGRLIVELLEGKEGDARLPLEFY